MNALAGLPLEIGLERLRGTGCEPWWFARSRFLSHACDTAEPRLGFARSTDPTSTVVRSRGDGVVFGFRNDQDMARWARANDAVIAMPSAQLVAEVADKTLLPKLADDAGVAIPRCVVQRSATADDAHALWRELGAERAVVQRAENDLTGTGTYRVDSPGVLADQLRRWGCRDVKLAAYVEGVPVTVSAVACAHETIVSGLSIQLVGYPELTPVWGAHCGNQLIDDRHLPPGSAEACRDAATRVGATLRAVGFRGMFGLDLIVTSQQVLVLEINPRVQSVSSLLNSAELAAGLLPAPLVHLLDFVEDVQIGAERSTDEVPPFGQLVVSALASGRVEAIPAAGMHRIARSADGDVHTVGSPAPLGELSFDQALVWPFASVGDEVGAGDRLYVMQTGAPVAEAFAATLTRAAHDWLADLARETRIEWSTM